MREVECSLEASAYLQDLWPYTEPVLHALIALRTRDPLPGIQIEPGVYLWETVQHTIIYERKGPHLRVTVIKPDADI